MWATGSLGDTAIAGSLPKIEERELNNCAKVILGCFLLRRGAGIGGYTNKRVKLRADPERLFLLAVYGEIPLLSFGSYFEISAPRAGSGQ